MIRIMDFKNVKIMKSIETKIVAIVTLLFALFITGCNNDGESLKSPGPNPALTWYKHTGCKSMPKQVKSRADVTGTGWLEEAFEYENKGNGKLYLKYVNAIFNCATEDIKVTASFDGDAINVIYQGIGNSANCVCPFDVECLMEGLAFGQYRVLVYRNDMSGLLYEFPLGYTENMPKGIYKPSNDDMAI